MITKNRTIICAGLLLLVVIFCIDYFVFLDFYLTGIIAIIFVVIGMSLFIMEDSVSLPEIGVSLKDDAKGISIINRGNDTAYEIHVALLPLDIEFDVAALDADAAYDYPMEKMITEAKASVTYKNAKGARYARTTKLSALGKSEDDLLKPMFPLFQWK
jgi:hypothetical protein